MSSSSNEDFGFTFVQDGTYTVKLTVTNVAGSDTKSETFVVQQPEAPLLLRWENDSVSASPSTLASSGGSSTLSISTQDWVAVVTSVTFTVPASRAFSLG